MRKILLTVLVTISFILPLVIIGCVPSKPSEDIELLPADRLVKKLEANRRKIRAFEGNGIIDIKSPSFTNSATFRVVLIKPDSIYLTILGPFGIELAQSLVTKNSFVFYEALSNTVYQGDMNDKILQTIFKVNLSFNDLLDAFIGAVNLTDNLYKSPTSYQVVHDKYLIGYADSTKRSVQNFRVDIRDLGITNYSVNDFKGNVLLEGEYTKFGILEGVAVPYRISIKNKTDNQQITIDYRTVIANSKKIEIDFRIPDDATVIQW